MQARTSKHELPQHRKIKLLSVHCVKTHVDRNGQLWAEELYCVAGKAFERWILAENMGRAALYAWLGY